MTTQNLQTVPRALIAMSGGVDSPVAACLMQQAGYDFTGITMRGLPTTKRWDSPVTRPAARKRISRTPPRWPLR